MFTRRFELLAGAALALAGLALAGLALPACTTGTQPTPDAGRIEPFVDGAFTCLYAEARACVGNVHYSCEPEPGGEFLRTVRVDCNTVVMDGRPSVCHRELGCTLCRPGDVFCVDGNVVTCDDTGQGYELTEECNIEEGVVCQQGRCQNLCQVALDQRSYLGCEFYGVDLDNAGIDRLRNASAQQYSIVVSNPSGQPTEVVIERNNAAVGEEPEIEIIATETVLPGDLEIFDLPRREVDGSSSFAPCAADSECLHGEACWCAGGIGIGDPGEHRDCRCRVGAESNGINDGTHSALSSHAYRVRSVLPVIAYQFNPLDNVDVFSNDASLLLPTNTFGTEYIAVSRFELQGRDDSGGTIPYRGFLSIVASSTGTDVTIQPAARTQAGPNMQTMVPGQSYTYALEPYQVLNVKTDQDKADLTGSIITANKPIAVFSGHEAAVSSTTCCADHLEHQLFPVATWGTEYLATKAMARGVEPDYWRVVAAQDGTTVTFEPSSVSAPRTLDRGQWYELATQADFKVTADKPIMLAQTFASSGEVVSPFAYSECTDQEVCAPRYECTLIGDGFFDLTSLCFPPMCFGESDTSCPGGHTCTCYPSGACYCSALGDPTLVLVPPLKQFRNEYVFLTPDKYARDFINLIAPDGASVTLDGTLVPAANFKAIAGTGWRVARIEVGDGVHSVAATAAVGVITYGYDRDVSYGYAAGLNLVDE